MVRDFPKSLNQPNEMAFTICNSISLHCFRLMRDWKLESFANGKEISAVPFRTEKEEYLKGYLPFTRENRKFRLENQMVRAIPFGKLQKIWAVIRDDAIFLLFEVSQADVDIFYSDSLSRNLAFNCFMFMPEISNRMVFVNGKHPL